MALHRDSDAAPGAHAHGGPKRAGGWLAGTGLTAAILLLTFQSRDLERRYDALESDAVEGSHELRRELDGLQNLVADLRSEVEDSSDRMRDTGELSDRLVEAEVRLGSLRETIDAHASSLEDVLDEQRSFEPDVLERKLSRLDERLEHRWTSVNALAASAHEAAAVSMSEIERLEAGLDTQRDLIGMWRQLLGPVVQLAGDVSVGSGVLLPASETDDGTFEAHLLTAWHVVRDIQGDLSNQSMPVPVFIYSEDGAVREEAAHLLAFDASLDAALLVVRAERHPGFGARLAPRSRLDDAKIFDRVYAVGCPLGNDPIPTHGEIATLRHEVDGAGYWMINAPTYIGNSGGGIFDSSTYELMGIFSKIYTHGTLRPTIVPHMGLVTPLTAIYDWLERAGFGHVVPEDPRGTVDPNAVAALGPGE